MKSLGYVLLGALLAFGGYRTYNWKHHTDTRTFYAERAADYLFNPSGVIGPDGREVSRQELFDAYMHAVVEHSPGFSFKK